ncbi:S-layer homology domain-containing protein [Paenibacillus chondroitinus]|uniref:S-layer homology domain-containing protein n=1 Tax=Paenibacillus chondroitinus TaxID=59842 RepID=A0ABU6D8K0_9BACL|nr:MULTISPECIES: S-layer homology domain-containing protein [Paenibacillus]MCY9661701.1 S-layer homology domain-containing protein [Paenibacillus anseongense]MEB4793786.1 S-layer homology domain-containing protein [Paenibacillus chondroitinus]
MKKIFKTMTLSAATAVFSLTLVGQSFAAAPSFTDLDKVAAKDKIMSLQQSGIVSGITPELFAPQAAMSEAQGVQLLVNAFKLNLDLVKFVKEPKATDYFVKATNDSWYANALITAAVNNVELPKDLDPNATLTREQFTHQLIRAMETYGKLPLINPVVVDIKDNDQITVEYSGSIQRAINYGVIKLSADGTMNPKAEITRADAAEEIFNAIEYLKAHQAPAAPTEALTATEGVKLITETLGLVDTDIKIKIDPNSKMTRESFTNLLVTTLQSSGKLPMIKIVPVDIKDNDQIDILNSGAIQTAIAIGAVQLNSDGKFDPKAEITRADATEITTKVVDYLKSHQVHSDPGAAITATEGVRLITETLGLVDADINIKIDPNSKMTRESFTNLLVQTLQSSGKLPMIKVVPVDIKDNDQIDILHSGSIQTAIALKIVKLNPDGTFNPKADITRVDATEIANNAVAAVKALPNNK